MSEIGFDAFNPPYFVDPLLDRLAGPTPPPIDAAADVYCCSECGRLVESGLRLIDHLVYDH